MIDTLSTTCVSRRVKEVCLTHLLTRMVLTSGVGRRRALVKTFKAK